MDLSASIQYQTHLLPGIPLHYYIISESVDCSRGVSKVNIMGPYNHRATPTAHLTRVYLRSQNVILHTFFQGDLDEFGEIMMWTGKAKSAEAKINNVLKQIRNDHFEIPFIATYRKECIQDDLTTDDLWKIYHWDER